jgi:hypothetical protein
MDPAHIIPTGSSADIEMNKHDNGKRQECYITILDT